MSKIRTMREEVGWGFEGAEFHQLHNVEKMT